MRESNTVRDPVGLHEAVKQLLERMQVAVSDLRQEDAERVPVSQADLQQSLNEVHDELTHRHDWAATIGWLTIILLLLWQGFASSRMKLVPAPLVAVVVATLAAATLELPVQYVDVPDNLWGELDLLSLNALNSVSFGVVLQAGIVLAVVASAETLLCATAVDQMQSNTRTDYDKELAAQGIGNMICGLLGVLPMTGVIVRSAANVKAGGKTRLATILHGVWLLIFVSALAFVLRMIPTAALAAILVYTGFKLINVKAILELRQYGWGEVVIYLATLAVIVCADLLTGVLVGMGLSAVKLLHTFSHLDARLEVNQREQRAILHLEGAATFIRLPLLASELERVPHNVELHVDFEHLNYIDHACFDLLMNCAKRHEATGGTLVIDWETLHADICSRPLRNRNAQRKAAA